ncbi:MAG: hypothetical protein B7Y07_06970 [Halothiobacillus sp. 24-54-40]|jgi:hypothetical protein|nr:MAG: hypothetical protein B7Y58_05530 [Halothiobacillus sp. 35-54-62]OYZ86709.1 MAG: hypothetical protein B7Y07_06970 [Halothiobacillus sp. 24-54-40]OZA80453.1 MAG: hypothetical protein B7X64_05885 [Halothiobacillus sp. 39-53-45]HQS02300.1 DUF4337 domain-containing protein [Halothiobacillus sp.]HQS29202.1 DUF4337 domain-containing protein [Halothiobacillus sp.]
MSHGLHTHAPHDEAVHEAAHGGGAAPHSLNQWVAIFTAIIAALGAMVSYQGSNLMNEVLLYKNEAVLKKTKATDEWNYYQAVSTKSHLMELAVVLSTPDRVAGFKDEIAKYKTQKVEIKQRADALEKESFDANAESFRLNKPHHDLEIAMIFFQIAISLASITALTGRRWLFGAGLLSATVGMGLWGMALVAMS